MYRHAEYYPGDLILGLVKTFERDECPEKVNLSIGIYFDDEGKMSVLESVRRAEAERVAASRPLPYLPTEGLDTYRSIAQHLLLGQDNQALAKRRVTTTQTLGGSGVLKAGTGFLHRWFPGAKAYVGDPTWDDHKGIFEGAGFEMGTCPYYDPEIVDTKFEEMTAFFKVLPEDSVLILHPCCQNPTDVDMSQAQWGEVLDIIKTRKLIPFMDTAYQGFGEDLDSDAYAIRRTVEIGLPLFVSNSFSKDLSLYNERVGGLSAVCPNEEEAELVLGQLRSTVRRIYSSPATHGAYIASDVMNSDGLCASRENEIYAMRDRIRAMCQELYGVLMAKTPNHDFRYSIGQCGMFSYTGLTVEQAYCLHDEFAIYLLDSDRVCVAGLSASSISYMAEAFAKALQQLSNLKLNVVLFEIDQKTV